MLLIDGLSCTGRKYAAISATIALTAPPSTNKLCIALRRTNHSMITAPTQPNHAAVVTASNMLEFGQRSAMYQRKPTAAVCNASAIANIAKPIVRARGHFQTNPSNKKIEAAI